MRSSAFGMDSVAVEKFQLFGERRHPGFAQAIVLEREVEFAPCAQNFHRQSVEKFVGEDDDGSVGGESTMNAACGRTALGLDGRGRPSQHEFS